MIEESREELVERLRWAGQDKKPKEGEEVDVEGEEEEEEAGEGTEGAGSTGVVHQV